MNKNLTQKDYLLISAYLDGELSLPKKQMWKSAYRRISISNMPSKKWLIQNASWQPCPGFALPATSHSLLIE